MQRASLHTQPLSSFCKKEDLSVIRAEVLFTDFLVEHSIQPAVADHTGELFRQMFPDSRIAKKYACARTKTTQIIKSMASDDSKNVNMSSVSAFYWFLKCTSSGASGGFAPLTPTGALPLDPTRGPWAGPWTPGRKALATHRRIRFLGFQCWQVWSSHYTCVGFYDPHETLWKGSMWSFQQGKTCS